MPQPRKYATRAEQQAAYRQRQARSQQQLLSRKGLPPLPAIPTMPGQARWRAIIAQARWRAIIAQAQTLLSEAAQQMQTYHDERSEQWQDGPRAEELLARLQNLQEAVALLQECE